MTIHVLMLCLGNICRSPMAEAVFQKMVDEAGLSSEILVDSAGTGAWHIGEPAHAGSRRILASHDIVYSGCARQITSADVNREQSYIIAMDRSNLADVKRRFGALPHLYLLLDFAGINNVKDVPDPYYSGGFDKVYELVEAGCAGLLGFLREDAGILEK